MHGERGLRKELDGEFLPDIAMSLVNTALQPEIPTGAVFAPGDATPRASRGVSPDRAPAGRAPSARGC